MSRPLSAPPFPQSPETWLAFFRYKAEAASGKHLSPEEIGEQLGVSGATVRRWEKGTAVPTDDDLVRFGALCGLSHHQMAFLRIAFNSFKTPMPPDPVSFRVNTEELLGQQDIPMLLMDELMYARAWNSYMPVLGPQAESLLDLDRHPIDRFFDIIESEQDDSPATAARSWTTVRSFWRFSATYSNACQYTRLVDQFHSHWRFARLWAELAENTDTSAIDIRGVAEVFLPYQGPKFRIVHSICSYPPLYSVFEFYPDNVEAELLLDEARTRGKPEIHFSNADHWSEVGAWSKEPVELTRA